MSGPDAHAAPVAPVLVRDYRRLLRLFPFAYRRAHEAEMLGHLLDGAAPGQSRPARGEAPDLVRAAAREWLLAPLGSTPTQRRAATDWLVVLLPLLVALPAAAGLVGALLPSGATGGLLSGVASTPFGPSWAVWLVGAALLGLGVLRTARVVLALAAVVAWSTVVVLIARGEMLAVYTGVGWAVGQSVCAVVVAEHARVQRPIRWSVWTRAILLVTAGVLTLPLAWIAQALLNGWTFGGQRPFGFTLGASTVCLASAPLVVAMLFSRRARHAVPVLVSVGAAVLIGRAGIFGSRTAPFYGVDLGDLIVLIVASAVLAVGLRWVVNRLDELGEARRRMAENVRPAVGGPTTT